MLRWLLVLMMFGVPVHAGTTLTLDEALDIAESRSAQLAAQKASASAAAALIPAAGQNPDPKLIAGIENVPVEGGNAWSLNADGMTMRRVGVMQEFMRGAKLDARDKGNRDTDKVSSAAAGKTWQAIDYAEGLVRVGVQSAVVRPEAAALIRKLMAERNMPAPPIDRTILSVCVVALCQGTSQ